LWQALPNKTNAEIMQIVRASASQYTTPNYFLGYGIPNFESALNAYLTLESNTTDATEISIYPNPVSDKLNIKLPSEVQIASLTLYNILGKQINTYPVSNINNTINMVPISKGIYLVKIETKKISKTFKLIKR
jgi:hypothetical protein